MVHLELRLLLIENAVLTLGVLKNEEKNGKLFLQVEFALHSNKGIHHVKASSKREVDFDVHMSDLCMVLDSIFLDQLPAQVVSGSLQEFIELLQARNEIRIVKGAFF